MDERPGRAQAQQAEPPEEDGSSHARPSRATTVTQEEKSARSGGEVLLARGEVEVLVRRGVRATEPPSVLEGFVSLPEVVRWSKYDPTADPEGAQRLGRLLADRLSGIAPTVVVVWQDVEDVVLGFLVARSLGTSMVRARDAEGIVEMCGQVAPGARAVVVTDLVREPSTIHALDGVVTQFGGTLVGIGTLVEAPEEEVSVPLRIPAVALWTEHS